MEEGAPLLPEPTTTTSRPRRSLILVALGVGSAALAGVLALSHARSSAAQTVAGTFALARADAAAPTPPPTMPCIKNGDDDCVPRTPTPTLYMPTAPPTHAPTTSPTAPCALTHSCGVTSDHPTLAPTAAA